MCTGIALLKAMHDRLTAKREKIGDQKFIEEIQIQSEESSRWTKPPLKPIENLS